MYDDDFMKWIHEMPVGYMQYLWRTYKMSYSDQSDFPQSGDNFTVVSRIEDPIDAFERLLDEDKITLQDLIRREE